MGDVGDQLGFHPLALQPLLHGGVDGAAQVVELFGVRAQFPANIAVHVVGVDDRIRLAAYDGRRAVPDGLPALCPAAQAIEDGGLVGENEDDGAAGEDGAHQIEEEQNDHPVSELPAAKDGGQTPAHGPEAVANKFT